MRIEKLYDIMDNIKQILEVRGTMATAKIVKVTCGILFNNSFSILDHWGKIADSILYKNSYFDPAYFPRISDQYTINRYVENPDKGHSLHLNSENLIYTHAIQSDFEQEHKEFVERVAKFVVPEVVQKYDLVVRRIGMVYICEMDQSAITNFTSQYFKPELTEVLDCRFSRRSTVPQALLMSGTNDYVNKIYSVGNVSNDFQGISFDYQLFFNPPIVDVKPRISKFFEKAKADFYEEIFKEEFRGR